MDLFQELNAQQRRAVTADPGPVLVLAGPGSGKTRVLTRRITYLIAQMGVRPYNILAVTFTNKAAREMENRVMDMLGDAARGVTLGTFHAVCARILRREAEVLPFQQNFAILDVDDQLTLVRHALADLNLDEKRNRPQGIHALISNAKNELILPETYPVQNFKDEVVKRVYQRYQELLLASNALDFDDLLLWTARLLEENGEVRQRYARRYEHILVDEFQDTNQAQYLLLKHLSSFHNNIFVVGDEDQSIYRWRGADYRNVLRFKKDFEDTDVVILDQNYRSTQAILDVAMAVIGRNPQRTPKRLYTDRGAGQPPILHEAPDDRVESAYIVEAIASQIAAHQAQPGDFAVMYRTNAQSRVIEEAFIHAGLPYKLVGAQRFYGRREVKDVVAYLRLISNPSDEVSLTRVINTPPRGLGEKTVLALRVQAQRREIPAGRLLLEMAQEIEPALQEALGQRAAAALAKFARLLREWCRFQETQPVIALMDRILADIEYRNYMDDGSEEGHDRWENVTELRRVASGYKERTLEDFLQDVALVSDQDTLDSGANVPTLLTLHAAKGLEFPVVFITGLNDGVLPHSRSLDDPEEMMEERRLFYVGITRARDQLYLTYASNRSSYGSDEPALPSRFLDDLPGDLGRSKRKRSTVRQDRMERVERWQPSSAMSRTQSRRSGIQPGYQAGMRVRHPTWGEGMVLNSRIQDEDEVLDIFFENVGLKKVVASLARLEILK